MSKVTPSPITHFSEYEANLRSSVDSVVVASSSLPDDLSFHRSLDRQFGKRLDSNSERILSLTSKLLDFIDAGNHARHDNSRKNDDRKGKRRLDSEEDVVDNFHSIVVDVLDQILERADMTLDELSGKNKPPAIPVNVKPENRTKPNQSANRKLDPTLVHVPHIPKPQLLFHVPVRNRNTNVPWRPQLRAKPNALVPLEEPMSDEPSSSQHPYSHEIQNFQPPAHLLEPPSAPSRPEPLESSPPVIYISETHQVPALLQALSQASEIAIDLEHHSYRSFSGFVCLMQISTRTQDWIVDCLNPGVRQELECLNEVFTNPNIVKVLHGADSDIIWLQQNFNLYIVNMFDTFDATKVLDFPKHSLAALLEMYCDFTADKRYQLADWRIRPLPTEMLDYARCDTHFLLYIYDNLRNALIAPRTPPPQQKPFEAASPLLEVIRRSSEKALKVYVREVYDAEGGMGPGGWEVLCRKWNKNTGFANDVHSEVFKAIHAWRDRLARKEDESTRYVLPNHNLFRIAERLPSDLQGLLSIFHPVPPLVRVKSLDLLDVIKKAIERSSLKASSAVVKPNSVVIVHDEDDNDNDKVRIIGSLEGASTTGVWDKLKAISNVAPSSTLFGSLTTAPPNYSTMESSLLGSSMVTGSPTRNEKYINAVGRVHSTLTLSAPLPPKSKIVETATTSVVTTTTTTSTNMTTSDSANAVPSDPTSSDSAIEEAPTPNPAAIAEIPFIPSSQRPTIIQDPLTKENIVVVGRQKKRKRKDKSKDATGTNNDADANPDADDDKKSTEGSPIISKKLKNQDLKEKSEVEMGSVEPYDFSKEKNILDESASYAAQDAAAAPSVKKRKDKRGNKQASHKTDKSSFGAAPRNRSEMKSGNMSGRFK